MLGRGGPPKLNRKGPVLLKPHIFLGMFMAIPAVQRGAEFSILERRKKKKKSQQNYKRAHFVLKKEFPQYTSLRFAEPSPLRATAYHEHHLRCAARGATLAALPLPAVGGCMLCTAT